MKKSILFLIILTICLCSCEKDLYDGMTENQHYGELNITQKSFDELISTEKFSNAFSKINKTKTNSITSKTVMEDQYNFTISNPIANVVELNSKTNYTFEITRNNVISSSDSFENLVVNVDSLNQVKAYIVKYFINKDYDSSKKMSPFRGIKYTPIVYNANIKSKITECITITYSLCSGDPYDCGGSICGFGELTICSGSGGNGGFDGAEPSIWEGGSSSNNIGTITFPVYGGGGGAGNKAQAIEDRIDDSKLDPCPKAIMDQLKNTSNSDITKILTKLGANSIYEVNMVMKPATTYAETQRISKYNYEIRVDRDINTDATTLFKATVLIHEVIHAYFLSIVDDYNYTPSTNIANFPELFEAYVLKNNPNSQDKRDAQHLAMANIYVDAMASALQEYDANYTVPYQVYQDLAWGSLSKTPIFDKTFPQGSADNIRIINRYKAEGTGHAVDQGTSNQQTPIGKPCK